MMLKGKSEKLNFRNLHGKNTLGMIISFHFYSASPDSIFILQIILVLKRTHSLDIYTNDGKFYRTKSGLTDVPDDIPKDALQVDLGHNNITQLKQNAFSQLHQCTHLNMWWNTISVVETGSFDGLHSLRNSSFHTID